MWCFGWCVLGLVLGGWVGFLAFRFGRLFATTFCGAGVFAWVFMGLVLLGLSSSCLVVGFFLCVLFLFLVYTVFVLVVVFFLSVVTGALSPSVSLSPASLVSFVLSFFSFLLF